MGYDGILYLGDKIADQIENPGFNEKLAAHARLPYKASWYEKDPFKFIKTVEKADGAAVAVGEAVQCPR
jgi:nitrogenase molybdenum-iron protein alpha chain